VCFLVCVVFICLVVLFIDGLFGLIVVLFVWVSWCLFFEGVCWVRVWIDE